MQNLYAPGARSFASLMNMLNPTVLKAGEGDHELV